MTEKPAYSFRSGQPCEPSAPDQPGPLGFDLDVLTEGLRDAAKAAKTQADRAAFEAWADYASRISLCDHDGVPARECDRCKGTQPDPGCDCVGGFVCARHGGGGDPWDS